MDNVPQGFTAGEDFVSIVSADNYGNGVASALIMGEALGGEGRVGVVFHAADFFVTRQRYDAFLATMAEQFPNIEIVAEQGIAGPDFAGQADQVASAMLTQNPDLNGIWAVWDVPAEGVINAVRTAGRAEDVIVTTIDLGQNVAVALAQGEIITVLAPSGRSTRGSPSDAGRLRPARQGGARLRALPALPVTQENVLEAWTQVYHQDPPAALAEAAG
jgi:ribose transport system substrate-binding protein